MKNQMNTVETIDGAEIKGNVEVEPRIVLWFEEEEEEDDDEIALFEEDGDDDTDDIGVVDTSPTRVLESSELDNDDETLLDNGEETLLDNGVAGSVVLILTSHLAPDQPAWQPQRGGWSTTHWPCPLQPCNTPQSNGRKPKSMLVCGRKNDGAVNVACMVLLI